jgi:phosphate transport system substrate-binding protein
MGARETQDRESGMKAHLLAFSSLAVLATALNGPAFAQTRTIAIDGSSTVFPIMEAVAEEFQKANKNQVRVTVGISGTGGGFKKFCRGETDMSNGSRPILKAEMEDCKKAGIEFYELPLAFDALTVATSPKNTAMECIKVEDLKKIWEPGAQGKVMKWSDANPQFPDRPLKLYGAGSDSGTFDYFTEAIVGKAKSSRGDYSASEDDNVLVQGIENDANSLGYIPYAYYAPHATKMKALAVDWGKGQGCVKPSLENVLAGTYNPLSRPLFFYVSKKAAEKPEVKEFVEFALTKAVPLIKEVKYLPLPDRAYPQALEKFKKGVTGTVFGGVPEVGLSIDELMKRESRG